MEIISDNGVERLCNGIIIQAAKDYRLQKGYLKNHPRTPELMAKVEKVKEDRMREKDAWVAREKEQLADRAFHRWLREEHEPGEMFDREGFLAGLKVFPPKRLFPITREELELGRIIKHESAVREVEGFFKSKWYTMLSDVDGEMILRKLEEEFADDGD